MSDKTGGPAYPVFPETGNGHAAAHQGMTLLDHFAGLAMQGLMSAHTAEGEWTGNHPDIVSHEAYEIAAAMLKARAKYLESDND